jgi:hypothetical protein
MNHVEIRPLRFTDRVAEVRAFLESLGMHARVESDGGGWVDLVAGAGMVALHDAATSDTGGRPGETRLSFEADDVTELSDRLVDAGFDDPAVWDEAYGRVLAIDVGDQRIWIDERSDDPYGYQWHRPRPNDRLKVTPIVTVPDPAPWQDFLVALGGTAAGLVSFEPGAFDLRLAFRTTEPLADLQRRLGGHLEAGVLTLIDPDGRPVQVSLDL